MIESKGDNREARNAVGSANIRTYVELRDNPHAPVPRVRYEIAHAGHGVDCRRRKRAQCEIWPCGRLDRHRDGICHVPVKDVQLILRHCIDEAQQLWDRIEAPARIQHDPPPRVSGGIRDGPGSERDLVAAIDGHHQLRKCLQCTQGAPDGGGVQHSRPIGLIADSDGVRLVCLECQLAFC